MASPPPEGHREPALLSGPKRKAIGAPTAHYYFPTAIIREFVGVLALNPLVHTAIGLALALVAGGLSYLIMG